MGPLHPLLATQNPLAPAPGTKHQRNAAHGESTTLGRPARARNAAGQPKNPYGTSPTTSSIRQPSGKTSPSTTKTRPAAPKPSARPPPGATPPSNSPTPPTSKVRPSTQIVMPLR